MTVMLDDDQLVVAVRSGEDQLFRELADRHAPWMHSLALRLLDHDHHLAEDVVQECLVKLHATLVRDDRPLRVRAWLSVVVRNACMDEHRRRRPVPLAELPETAVHDNDPFDLDPHLAQAWEAVSPRFREVLHHRELLGLSYDEIAAAMGTTRSAVQTLLFRARASLRREYRRAGGELLGCGAFGLTLLSAVDGEQVADAGKLAAHLGRCSSCQSATERATQLGDLLRGYRPGPRATELAESGRGLLAHLGDWGAALVHGHHALSGPVAQAAVAVGSVPLSAAAALVVAVPAVPAVPVVTPPPAVVRSVEQAALPQADVPAGPAVPRPSPTATAPVGTAGPALSGGTAEEPEERRRFRLFPAPEEPAPGGEQEDRQGLLPLVDLSVDLGFIRISSTQNDTKSATKSATHTTPGATPSPSP
jgi:RNA polymerase sigma-70 factor (ECF subfamily)